MTASTPAPEAPAADCTDELLAAVDGALRSGQPIYPVGGNSKAFLAGFAEPLAAEPLSLQGHSGIVAYDPTDLVITARAGTPLTQVMDCLAAEGQMLGFEPPLLSADSTIGGVVAAGLSGPRRPWAGAARDFVLGVRMINGRGELLRFGGAVIKNVAGYDIPRLMCASLGTLGVITEVFLRVIPRPETEVTLRLAMDMARGIERMAALARQPLPLSGLAHDGESLWVRLSGTAVGVAAAANSIGGDEADGAIWASLRDYGSGLLAAGDDRPLWRFCQRPAAPLARELGGQWLLDWGGAQRWWRGDADPAQLAAIAARAGGTVSCFRGAAGLDETTLAALVPPTAPLQRRVKAAFDPEGIFSPRRIPWVQD